MIRSTAQFRRHGGQCRGAAPKSRRRNQPAAGAAARVAGRPGEGTPRARRIRGGHRLARGTVDGGHHPRHARRRLSDSQRHRVSPQKRRGGTNRAFLRRGYPSQAWRHAPRFRHLIARKATRSSYESHPWHHLHLSHPSHLSHSSHLAFDNSESGGVLGAEIWT